jgi:DNA-binding transcriptional regulator YhcF (GntR family)
VIHRPLGEPARAALGERGIVTGDHSLKIPTHYTHQHLGTMVGDNREAVTRAFEHLQDEGIVELRRRLIYVPDAEALRRRAEDHVEEQRGDLEERTP